MEGVCGALATEQSVKRAAEQFMLETVALYPRHIITAYAVYICKDFF